MMNDRKRRVTRLPALTAAVGGGLLLSSCAPAEPPEASEPEVWFREVARERGLDFEHVRGGEERFWFPEIMGAGLALLDYDGDGRLDTYLVQSGDLAGPRTEHANKLFRNVGGTFEDVTEEAGVGDRGYGMGCAVGDLDSDGHADLYVTNVGPNALFRNRGNGSFAEIGRLSGTDHPGWGTSTTFLDHDADGDLDLFVVNYLRWSAEREKECLSEHGEQDYCSPRAYQAPAPDVLYENQGDGTFADISAAAGLGAAFGNGLGVVAADLDGDGRVDLYVANDMMPNQLWRNRGDGSFEDVALLAGCAANMDGSAEAGMGTVAFDVENDGDLDLFLTHLRDETNTFYRNRNGIFSDRTSALGLGAPSRRYTGFGVGFADFDHDGLVDLFVANGAVTRNRPPFVPGDPYAEPNQLFRGEVDERDEVVFTEVGPPAGPTDLVRVSRGTALGDLDDDGDLDVVVVDSGERVVMYENVAARGHWLMLRLLQSRGSDALGASARVTQPGSADVQWRTVLPGASYCSSNDPRLHFGLGANGDPVEVSVRWSDGTEEDFGGREVDRVHELVRGTGVAAR